MAKFLRCMKADYGKLLREMLAANDLLPLVWLCKSDGLTQLQWARQLTADVARIRSVTAPLRSLCLQFPGFYVDRPIRCTSGHAPLETEDPLGDYEDLLTWLEDNGLGRFTPCRAVLVLNAWPRSRRDAAAALSDFLADANTNFAYLRRRHTRTAGGTTYDRMEVKAVVSFTYKGLTGSFQVEDQYEWRVSRSYVY